MNDITRNAEKEEKAVQYKETDVKTQLLPRAEPPCRQPTNLSTFKVPGPAFPPQEVNEKEMLWHLQNTFS